MTPRAPSSLEESFAELADANPHWGPYRREVKLIRGRRFSMDFVFDELKLVVEIDGIEGGKRPSDHCKPIGVSNDREKDALLQLLGWHIIRFTTHHITAKPPKRKPRTRKKTWVGYIERTMNRAAELWGTK